jgi:hypothetical protein
MSFLRTFCIAAVSSHAVVHAQPDVVQLSGLVLTSDSLAVIPLVSIRVEGTTRGTSTDFNGFFTLAVRPSDTLRFGSIGYKEERYVVPENLDRSKYSIIQLLTRDTIHLAETVIYPWPTPDEFKEALLALNIPDDDLERAKKNLDRERLKEISEQMGADADQAQDFYAREENYRHYYYGQSPPIQILNPFAWAEFFKAWRRGDFKKRD